MEEQMFAYGTRKACWLFPCADYPRHQWFIRRSGRWKTNGARKNNGENKDRRMSAAMMPSAD